MISGKIKLVTILISVLLVVLGVMYLFNQYSFYKGAQKAEAVITNISRPDICPTPGQCKFGRKVSITFSDSNQQTVSVAQELSTITLISGVFTTGDHVKVLYKPTPTTQISIIPNIGPKTYDVKFYTWHYWAYPILLILAGPLLYWIVRKLSNRRIQN